MEGLLSSDLNPDAWRVTDAASLLNDVPEPGAFTLLSTGIGLAGLAIADAARLPESEVDLIHNALSARPLALPIANF